MLSSFCSKNGTTLIAVVLQTDDSRSRFTESRALLDYGFKHINSTQTIDTKNLTSNIYIHHGTSYKTTIEPSQKFTYPVMDNENPNDFSYQVNLPKYIDAPSKKDTKVGSVDLLYKGHKIGSVDLVTTENINEGFNFLGFLHKLLFS